MVQKAPHATPVKTDCNAKLKGKNWVTIAMPIPIKAIVTSDQLVTSIIHLDHAEGASEIVVLDNASLGSVFDRGNSGNPLRSAWSLVHCEITDHMLPLMDSIKPGYHTFLFPQTVRVVTENHRGANGLCHECRRFTHTGRGTARFSRPDGGTG